MIKTIFWKFLTAIVVTLLILNPEFFEFAIFINAIGLDLFILLLQVQVLATVNIFYGDIAKPILQSFNAGSRHLFLRFQPAVVFMQLLVLSVMFASGYKMLPT